MASLGRKGLKEGIVDMMVNDKKVDILLLEITLYEKA